jgi:hypothetical protein
MRQYQNRDVSGTSETITRSTVCTLYEGDYHYGVGALTNSLHHHGFRGDIWVGHRGPVPPWAHPVEQFDTVASYRVVDGLMLRFVPLDTLTFLANYKPQFALRVLDQFAPDADAVFYFDPDIVIKCEWLFYEAWAARGFACCEDNCYPHMPGTHPLRLAWLDFAANYALAPHRKLDAYYNSGFFGVTRGRREVLDTWRKLLELLESDGRVDLASPFKRGAGRHDPFFVPDQDALNLTLMLTQDALSTIGPEGMDFTPAGYTMSHAVDTPKPWRKRYLWNTLRTGVRMSLADREYWRYANGPIQLYSGREALFHTIDRTAAKVLGRIVAR